MRDCLFRKGLVVGIIVLFIGVGVYPAFAISTKTSSYSSISVSENENLDNDLIEINVEMCNIGGGKKHTVWLSQEESDSLDILIEDFKEKLDNSESLEDTRNIHFNMIISLNELGLLPDDIDVSNRYTLLSDIYSYGAIATISNNFLNIVNYKFFNPDNMDVKSNYLCYVAGETTNTKKGIFRIGIGFTAEDPHDQGTWFFNARGWIHTYGILGNVSWDSGELTGACRGIAGINMFGGWRMIEGYRCSIHFWPGIFGFFGTSIKKGEDKYFYEGFAYMVKIRQSLPPFSSSLSTARCTL